MASINKVILIGNLGTAPKLRQTQGGPVCSLFVITNESWTDRDGNRQESSEGHSVTVWGKQAENCARYLAKGRQVYIEGSIHSRTYSDSAGIERKSWDIKARTVQFLSGGAERPQQGGGGYGQGQQRTPPKAETGWGKGSGSQQPAGNAAGGSDDDPIPF